MNTQEFINRLPENIDVLEGDYTKYGFHIEVDENNFVTVYMDAFMYVQKGSNRKLMEWEDCDPFFDIEKIECSNPDLYIDLLTPALLSRFNLKFNPKNNRL